MTAKSLQAAFDKLRQQDQQRAEHAAEHAVAWAEAFPSYDHFTDEERAFLSLMYEHGQAGEPVHPKQAERLEELRRR